MADVDVLETLRAERDKLQSELERVEAAISAYQGGSTSASRRSGSRKRSSGKQSSRKRGGGRKKGSTHSAATKRKISQAMKKRWAERKAEEES